MYREVSGFFLLRISSGNYAIRQFYAKRCRILCRAKRALFQFGSRNGCVVGGCKYCNRNTFFVHTIKANERRGQGGKFFLHAFIRCIGRNIIKCREGYRFVTIWGSTVHKHGRSVQLKIIISAHMNLILVICHCKRSAFQKSRSPENVEISGEPYQKEIKPLCTSLFCIKKRPGSLTARGSRGAFLRDTVFLTSVRSSRYRPAPAGRRPLHRCRPPAH